MPLARANSDRELFERLRDTIGREGPISIDRYMQTCLADPEHGYWRRAATIGAAGDFVTAPEISQVFGELIGLWSAVAWEGMGAPTPVRFVELGPGRGTLMRDALRAVRAIEAFQDAATVHLVEVSAPLRAVQAQALASQSKSTKAIWHETLREVPSGPAIVIANEFLDALPIRQLVYAQGAWRERVVDLAPGGGLRFALGRAVSFQAHVRPEEGAIVELRCGELDVLAAIAVRKEPIVALFIDYGPVELAFGDTLQAVSRHAYADPLTAPGTCDLTAHVQFAGLAQQARKLDLAADGPMTQAEFLGRLGIVERAGRLMSANADRAGEIEAAVQRLISPTGMGGLYKVLAVRSLALSPPAPFG